MNATSPSGSNQSRAGNSAKWIAGVVAVLAALMIVLSLVRPATAHRRTLMIVLAFGFLLHSGSVFTTHTRSKAVLRTLGVLLLVGAILFDIFSQV